MILSRRPQGVVKIQRTRTDSSRFSRCLKQENEEYWEELIRDSQKSGYEFGEELHEPIVGWWHNDWVGIEKDRGAD